MARTSRLRTISLRPSLANRLPDIRSRRTKLVAPNIEDLALLEQRGLITMDDGELVLTDAANSVIDPELAL